MFEFLNNGSIAAFVGAFAAFVLVMATDLRRRYRTRGLLRLLVSDNLDYARNKLEAVKMNRALFIEDRRITDAPIMRFPTQLIRDTQTQVLDLLSANEMQSTNVLLYWMEAVDDMIGKGSVSASEIKRLEKIKAPDDAKALEAKDYVEIMGEAEKNLGYLIKLCESYVQGRTYEIIEFTHPVDP